MRTLAAALGMLAWVTAPAMAQPGTFVSQYCVSCHGAPRPAAGLNLVGFDADAPSQRADIAERMIAKVRAGMMPPLGSPRPDPASRLAFVIGLERRIDAAAMSAIAPHKGPMRRLNRGEYARVVFDLFGLEIDPTQLLAPDTLSAGFDNIGESQTFSPVLVTGYLRGASAVSRLVVTSPASRKRVFICNPTSRPGTSPRQASEDSSCAARILGRVITQAYRGQSDVGDVRDALTFFSKGRTDGGFDNGIRLALESILISPKFTFHLESPALRAQAIASRLSFFLWGSGPDQSLMRAATQGTLDAAGLISEARRMMADPRASALSTRFAAQWLRLRDLEGAGPDRRVFPTYDAELIRAMRVETELFVDSIRRDDRSVLDLITADYSYLNDRLARHYGVDGVAGRAFRRVTVPDERRGLFGQGSVLASTSVADRTSPVLRGKWILEVLLGMPPPPPPPNVPALDDTVRAVQGERRLSTRERMEAHRRNPSCSSCHRTIDPLGLALESFDATGARRVLDNGVAVDTSAELYDGTRIEGPAGLRATLLDHKDMVLRTFTQNLMTYALGRRVSFEDMPAIRAIVTAAEGQSYRLSAFVLGVVTSAQFRAGLEEGS